MRNTLGGYTLLEVMIFLAISGLLLFATILAVGGQQAHTEFRNSMNDINTKIQSWIDQVGNGYTSNGSEASVAGFRCEAPGNAAPLLLANAGRERGTNPDCVFLGKVLHFNTSEALRDRIFAYQIVGRRTTSPAGGETEITSTLYNAKPVAADSNQVDLTEEYRIPNGTKIVWTRSGSSERRLVGIFSNFNTESALVGENGSLSLMAVLYPFADNSNPKSPRVNSCISLNAPDCLPSDTSLPNPYPLTQWQACFESTRNGNRARITISSTQGVGISTKLDYQAC